jgi:hypothetical protein
MREPIHLFTTSEGRKILYDPDYWDAMNITYPINNFSDHMWTFVIITFLYFLAHQILRIFFILPFGKRWVVHNNGTIVPGQKIDRSVPPDEDELFKFEQAAWRFLYHSFNLGVGLYMLSGQEWVFDVTSYSHDWPELPFPFELRIIYILCICAYIYNFILMFVEPRQKDFWPMFTHHVTTLFLTLSSWYFGHVRAGVLVVILTDIADPIMDLAKVFLYGAHTTLADITFALFGVVFIVSRNYYFPRYILYHSAFYTWNKDGRLVNWCESIIPGLYVLQVLFIYWGYLIIKMAVGMYIKGEERGDIREIKKEKDD